VKDHAGQIAWIGCKHEGPRNNAGGYQHNVPSLVNRIGALGKVRAMGLFQNDRRRNVGTKLKKVGNQTCKEDSFEEIGSTAHRMSTHNLNNG